MLQVLPRQLAGKQLPSRVQHRLPFCHVASRGDNVPLPDARCYHGAMPKQPYLIWLDSDPKILCSAETPRLALDVYLDAKGDETIPPGEHTIWIIGPDGLQAPLLHFSVPDDTLPGPLEGV